MSGIKTALIPLAIAVAILSNRVYGQAPVVNETYKKWLNCSVFWMYSAEEVGHDFSVTLSFRGAPVGGTRVTLVPSGHFSDDSNQKRLNVTAETDSAGGAYFFSVPSGDYMMTVGDGLLFDGPGVSVTNAEESARDIHEEWPIKTISARNLQGRLVAPSAHNETLVALSHTSVKLLDLRTGQVQASTFTDRDGSYVFSNVDAGLYALRVTPSGEKRASAFSGDVAVELDPSAKEEMLPELKVLQSGCNFVELRRKTKSGEWE